MSQISLYALVDLNDQEQDDEYEDYEEALAEAQKLGFAIIERTYEYTDSELVWTPDGGNSWPPKKRKRKP